MHCYRRWFIISSASSSQLYMTSSLVRALLSHKDLIYLLICGLYSLGDFSAVLDGSASVTGSGCCPQQSLCLLFFIVTRIFAFYICNKLCAWRHNVPRPCKSYHNQL